MAQKKETAVVYSQEELAPGIFSLWITTGMAKEARPGQFIAVYCRDGSRLLPRPISICEIDPEEERLRLVYRIAGAGTEEFSSLVSGDPVEIMGPLGNGFTLLDSDKTAVVVGGGIGVPPMLQTAKSYGKNATAILGFRSADKIVLTDDFEAQQNRVMLCTDDGSAGHHGVVTDLLKQRFDEGKPDIVYACGPKVMLKFVAKLCAEYGVRCQVSLEERMACGVGACLGCATPIRRDDGSVTYLHVCKDGPVFDAERVVFDD